MFKKILIIGCGLIGSSILRDVIDKKLSKKVFVFISPIFTGKTFDLEKPF